ncbi:AMP-binding protein [Sphingopyxis sp.]|uniref:AMP-binding protein n=1 Tax=Sphingopyxis sp. TaxID=1908224 RepID=UPI003BA8CA97
MHDPDELEIALHPRLLEVIAEAAERFPDRQALVHLENPLDDKPRIWTFREVIDAIHRVAFSLRSAGVKEGDAVAILSPTTPDTLIAFVAASSVATAFPVNPLLAPAALAQQLALARARACIAYGPDPELPIWDRLQEVLMLEQPLELLIEIKTPASADHLAKTGQNLLNWNDFLHATPSAATPPNDPNRVAALFHTGGTSGNPKLAELGERALAAGPQMAAAACAWSKDDRILCALPHFHVGGTLAVTLSALSRGASVYTIGRFGGRDPGLVRHFWALCANHGITVPSIVPTSWSAVIGSAEGEPPKSLRGAMTGGAAAPAELVERVERKLGVPMSQVFGMTELAGICSAQPVDGIFRAHAVGYPAPGLKIALDPIAPGLSEVRIGGPNLFLGYRTADGRVGEPGEWLRSGDLGAFDESGQLQLLGRSKDVIIRSGHNIDPVAIEEAAYLHPGVRHAAAVGLPDAYAGELPILFVVRHDNADLSDLERTVEEGLVEPPARPRMIVVIDEMPLTPVGKIERFKLRQRAAVIKSEEVLADFAPARIGCDDVAARAITIEWGDRRDIDLARIDRLLGEIGLTASHVVAG